MTRGSAPSYCTFPCHSFKWPRGSACTELWVVYHMTTRALVDYSRHFPFFTFFTLTGAPSNRKTPIVFSFFFFQRQSPPRPFPLLPLPRVWGGLRLRLAFSRTLYTAFPRFSCFPGRGRYAIYMWGVATEAADINTSTPYTFPFFVQTIQKHF